MGRSNNKASGKPAKAAQAAKAAQPAVAAPASRACAPVPATPQPQADAALGEAELRYYDIGSYDQRRRRVRRFMSALVVLAFALAVAAVAGLYWWEQVRDPSIEAYATREILITGLGEDFTVTPQELLAMDCVWESATGKSSSSDGITGAKTADVYGPTLKTFLAEYGYELTDFSKIKAICADDYYVILRPQKEDIYAVLSIANGKDALYEQQRPLRLVLPDAESSRWAYGVVEIQFTKMKHKTDDETGGSSADNSDLPSVLRQGKD